MTFAAFELSADAGSPVLLFDFFVGTAHWRYTTAAAAITYAANEYDPLAIDAGSINQGNEIRKKTLAVKVPLNALVVSVLQNFPPSNDFMLTITALHQTDPDLQGFNVFVGRVVSQSQAGATVTMSCEPAYTGVKAVGLRRRFQLNCAHVLYALGSCTLLPINFQVITAIASIDDTAVTCTGVGTALPAGQSFAGGYIEWDSGLGYLERRSINSIAGDVLTIAYGSPDLIVGLALNAYPGCDHTTTNCIAMNPPGGDPAKGNILNYGGQPYIPTVNPLTGNPIY
jgi:hypothetical protein